MVVEVLLRLGDGVAVRRPLAFSAEGVLEVENTREADSLLGS